MSAVNMKITLFSDVHAQSKDEYLVKWEDLLDSVLAVEVGKKEEQPMLKFAEYGDARSDLNALRFDENVLSVSGIEGDYDAGKLSIDDALDLMEKANIECVIYPSSGYTVEHPKWRILCPFKHAFTSTKEEMKAHRKKMVQRVDNVLGNVLDRASYTLSLAFYCGRITGMTAEADGINGRFIDECDDLNSDPPVKAKKKTNGKSPPSGYTEFPFDDHVLNLYSEENYHGSLKSLTAHYAGKQLAVDEIVAAVEAIAETSPNKGEKFWPRYEDIERLAETAFDKFHTPKSKTDTKFKFISAADAIQTAVNTPMEWCIRDVLPEGLTEIFGPSGHYKTFSAVDMACCIATGTQWHGHRVREGAVAYIAGEGNNHLARRMLAWSLNSGISLDDAPLVLSSQGTDLSDEEVIEDVIQRLNDGGIAPRLVVLDTLARNFGTAEENSNSDMNMVVRHIDIIRAAFPDVAVVLVHHTGYSDATRGRGASSLFGALDGCIKVAWDVSLMMVKMECTKMKEAPQFMPMHFRREIIPLGFVDDVETGELASSVVLLSEMTADARGAFKRKFGWLFKGKRDERVVPILELCYPEGASRKAIGALFDVSPASVKMQVDELVESGWLDGKTYAVTEDGIVALQALSDNPHYQFIGVK